jgi:uncharacterized protein YdeI (YjbR/CyaY-like superfamily)
MEPRYFPTPARWRAWLKKHHASASELLVGFHKRDSGKPSITWPESVDEALCFGWIDGLRRGIDAESYMIRFSPRKADSKWSQVNLKRFAELETQGLAKPAGRAARAKWADGARAGYSYETSRTELEPAALAKLKADAKAWRFWQAQVPSYRKMVANWQASPKREETRVSRLATLIDCCARGKAIPPVAKWVQVKQPQP